MRFHPLWAAVAGLCVMASISALLKDHGRGEGEYRKAYSQQHETAAPSATVNPPTSDSARQGAPCPGTGQSEFDCNTISAIANVRQADAAERFNWLAIFEIFVALVTATVAGLAAMFAKDAANAATKSFEAFVAAEDAHLVLDFKAAPSIEMSSDGGVERHYGARVVVSNVGHAAARLQQLFMDTADGSLAVPMAVTLKQDESTELREKVWISAKTASATLSLVYSTSLHPVTRIDFFLKVNPRFGKSIPYVERTRIGRPR